MLTTDFYVNTAMMCYICRWTAVTRMRMSWRDVAPIGQETEVLDVVFVSCAVCSTFPGVHEPSDATMEKYVGSRFYSDEVISEIRNLIHIFDCTPTFLKEKRFSITAMWSKTVTRIREPTEIYCIPMVPSKNIMILEHGEEVRANCRFFLHEDPITDREISRYPSDLSPASKAQYERNEECMPFASVANRPPVRLGVSELTAPLCASRLLDLPKTPRHSSNEFQDWNTKE
jgi:hypothetical protein